MAQFGHVRAQLMGAAGDRFQRHPGQARAQEPQREKVGLGAFGIGMFGHFGGMDADHLFAFSPAMTRSLFQPVFDRTAAGVGHARNHGPIDLARLAVAQSLT